jgi:hypothetical protein
MDRLGNPLRIKVLRGGRTLPLRGGWTHSDLRLVV